MLGIVLDRLGQEEFLYNIHKIERMGWSTEDFKLNALFVLGDHVTSRYIRSLYVTIKW